jgi:hypothetical protein
MKKSVKAALFSCLVFPGTGHFILKRYQRGLIFFIPAMLGLLFIIKHAAPTAFLLLEQIQLGTVTLDANAISSLIASPPGDAKLPMLSIASWTIVACWLISIVDSFRLGRIDEQAKARQKQN